MKVAIIGRGTYKSRIANRLNVPFGNSYGLYADFVINYGLCGEKFRRFFSDPNRNRNQKILNNISSTNKFYALMAIASSEIGDVIVPESVRCRLADLPSGEWLFKPFYSLGGRNITLAHDYPEDVSGYFQRRILDRKYELRVHANAWARPDEFLQQKRTHTNPDTLAWNHHNGGSFITVKNPLSYAVFRKAASASYQILKALNYDFGAVDFIVGNDYTLYFLEVNAAPGFQVPPARTVVFDYYVTQFNNRIIDEMGRREEVIKIQLTETQKQQIGQISEFSDIRLDNDFLIINR